MLLVCFFIPTFVPWYVWGESLWVAYFVPVVLRYTLVLNATWLVNSAAHMWGNRPYDNTINPRENKYVAFGAIGTSNPSPLSPPGRVRTGRSESEPEGKPAPRVAPATILRSFQYFPVLDVAGSQ